MTRRRLSIVMRHWGGVLGQRLSGVAPPDLPAIGCSKAGPNAPSSFAQAGAIAGDLPLSYSHRLRRFITTLSMHAAPMAKYLRYSEDGCEQFVAWQCVSHAKATEEGELELTVGAPFGKTRKIRLQGAEAEEALATLRKLATFDWKEAVSLLAEAMPAKAPPK